MSGLDGESEKGIMLFYIEGTTMKFVKTIPSKLSRVWNFDPYTRKIVGFVAKDLVDLDEIAVFLEAIAITYGKEGNERKWMSATDRLTSKSEECLEYYNGKWSVCAYTSATITYRLEIVFRDNADAVQFKLAHC